MTIKKKRARKKALFGLYTLMTVISLPLAFAQNEGTLFDNNVATPFIEFLLLAIIALFIIGMVIKSMKSKN